MGKAFAADFRVTEDGAVCSLHYKAGFGVPAGHVGYKAQRGVQLGTVAIAGILGSQGNHLGLFRSNQGIQGKQAIQLAKHYRISTLLAKQLLRVTKRIYIHVTSILQGVSSEQIDTTMRVNAITEDTQFRELRMASTVRKPMVQIDLVARILEN